MPVDMAFVTVSYNTLEYVQRLTDFFNRLEVPFTFSFTVVDNNSHDGSQEYLQSHPEIHYLQTGENIGYGRGINRGVAATASKYICVTNTDVVLNREALITLWRFLEERQDVGVCAPRITYADGRDQGMLFHHSLFSHVFPLPTLFDEDFFFYHEDTSLAHALKNRGVSCYIIPDATIIHIGGKSSSAGSVSLFYKSKYLYLRKFYGPLHTRAICFLDRLRILRKLLFYSLLSLVVGSERIKTKQRHYKVAWSSAFLK